MNQFTVDVLTPNKVIARDVPAVSLIIPTVRGQINVLPDHTHIVSRLATGHLTAFGGASDSDRSFTVSYGICKVVGNKVSILCNTCEEDHEIDAERAQLALDNANSVLKGSENLTDDDIEKYQRKAERAQIRLQIAKRFKK